MSQYPPPGDPNYPANPNMPGQQEPTSRGMGAWPGTPPPAPGQYPPPPGYSAPPSQPMYPGYPPQQMPPGFPQQQMSGGSKKPWIVPVAIVVAVVLVLGVVLIPRLTTPSSIQGTWAGTGVIKVSDSGESSLNATEHYGFYMDVTESSSGSLSGTGKVCFHNSGSSGTQTQTFTVSGSKGSDGTYSMNWNSAGSPLKLHAALSGSSVNLSTSQTEGTASISLTGSGSHGTESAFQAACGSLPTP